MTRGVFIGYMEDFPAEAEGLSPVFVPKGPRENSPAFQCREPGGMPRVPKGRLTRTGHLAAHGIEDAEANHRGSIVAQTSQSAVSRVSNPRAVRRSHPSNRPAARRLGSRRYSRLGNLRHAGSGVAPRRRGFPQLERGLKPTPTLIKPLRDRGLAERGHDGSRGFQPTESHNRDALVAARRLTGQKFSRPFGTNNLSRAHPALKCRAIVMESLRDQEGTESTPAILY